MGKKPAASTSGIFSNKRNSANDDIGGGNDLLDAILDDIEEKKGIESTKPKSKDNTSHGSHSHGRNDVSGTGFINNPP